MSHATTTLNRFRIWCDSEQKYVFVWSAGDDVPTQCPNDSTHTIDTFSAVIVDSLERKTTEISNLPVTPFDRILTSEETVVVDVKPGMGLSRLRDKVHTVGTGSVISEVGDWEYALSVDGAGAVASLQTAERGPFVSGLCAEVGIGGRLGAFPQGDQTVRYGAFDPESGNGYFLEVSSIGVSAVVMKDGNEKHRAHMTQFNVDTMDGQGPSKLILDASRGYAWTIRYAMYGYGCIEFAVAAENINLEQHIVPMHRYYTRSDPSISCSYLPVWVEVASPTQDTPVSAFVTGRKHSVLGAYHPDRRETHVARQVSAGSTPSFTVLAVRKKAQCVSLPVIIEGIETCWSLSQPLLLEIVLGTTQESTSWSSVEGQPSSESVIEIADGVDVLEADPQAVVLWRGFGHTIPRFASVNANLVDDSAICVRTTNASQAGLLSICLHVSECW